MQDHLGRLKHAFHNGQNDELQAALMMTTYGLKTACIVKQFDPCPSTKKRQRNIVGNWLTTRVIGSNVYFACGRVFKFRENRLRDFGLPRNFFPTRCTEIFGPTGGFFCHISVTYKVNQCQCRAVGRI